MITSVYAEMPVARAILATFSFVIEVTMFLGLFALVAHWYPAWFTWVQARHWAYRRRHSRGTAAGVEPTEHSVEWWQS